MSRAIKFRAWDRATRTMRPVNALGWKSNTVMLETGTGTSARCTFENTDLMQFTGLTDKNGKEIYEGDIFECLGGRGEDMMQGEIYFDDGCFRMKYGYQKPGERRKDYFLSSIVGETSMKLEVIGNIYEHANLLPA